MTERKTEITGEPGNETATGFVYEPSYINDDTDIIRIPNDFFIEYVKLYPWNGAAPLDLTNVRGQINIYEDIFSNFVTGNIEVIDTWDLPTLYPIVGEEILEISFYRQGTKLRPTDGYYPEQKHQEVDETERYKMTFRVTKMTDRKLAREKSQYYVLHFVSPELIQNKKKKVRWSFKKKLYSEMVQIIYDATINMGKPIEIEETKFEQDFSVSNWTPAQSINIISSRSLPAGRNGSSYVFFETLKGFRFVTLEKLYEEKPKEDILYQWSNVNLSPENKKIEEEIRNVHSYDFVDYFDVLSNLQHGMYASKLMTYDLVRQRFFEYDFDYLKEFKKHEHLSDHELCTDKLDALGEPYLARFNLMGTNKDHDIIPWIAGKEPGIMPMKIEEYVLPRQSQIQQPQNVRMAITLPGSPNRRAGDVLNFMLPNAMGWPEKYADEPERYLSGKYLITAVRHRIEISGYAQDLEIVKDTYKSKIEYVDPVPKYEGAW